MLTSTREITLVETHLFVRTTGNFLRLAFCNRSSDHLLNPGISDHILTLGCACHVFGSESNFLGLVFLTRNPVLLVKICNSLILICHSTLSDSRKQQQQY